eukprot:7295932-Alexandrium_andersonii.AAC.1
MDFHQIVKHSGGRQGGITLLSATLAAGLPLCAIPVVQDTPDRGCSGIECFALCNCHGRQEGLANR